MQGGHPIAYESQALTETDTRYTQIEKEMLAIVFAVERLNDYTFGNKTFVFSDHAQAARINSQEAFAPCSQASARYDNSSLEV